MIERRTSTNLTTAAFVATAAVSAWLALTLDPMQRAPQPLSEEGEVFFPDFSDPLACAAVEVVGWDETTATAQPLKVEQRGKSWILKSHHDYPARAQEQVVRIATALVDLHRDALRSMSTSDHAAYGVVDPLDTESPGLTGRGKRVTLRSSQDVVLADYVLGLPVEGEEGQRYVRVPGEKGVYAVKTAVDPSPRFRDWVSTDLLGIRAGDITGLRLLDYSVDERTGSVGEIRPAEVMRNKDGWTAAGEGVSAVNQATIDRMLTALGELGIVNVQPKPATLAQDLREGGGLKFSFESIGALRRRGFYFTPAGQLLSNEGELRVTTSHGVVFTLRFGEIAQGGVSSPEEEPAPGPATGDTAPGSPSLPLASSAPSVAPEDAPRYLFLTARFDETRMADTDGADAAPAAEAGQARADRLTRRFAPWFYVISGEDFARLRPHRDELLP